MRFLFPSCLIVVVAAALQPASSALGATPHKNFNGYCGIYSLYGALCSVGNRCSFDKLLSPKYIGHASGSTLEELRLGAIDNGAYAVGLGGLGAESLETVERPMILHVSQGDLQTYRHWVLLLGVHDGKVRLVDAPNEEYEEDLSGLLTRWDGTALIVSHEPINVAALIGQDWLRQLWAPALAIGIVLVVSVGGRVVARSQSLSTLPHHGLSAKGVGAQFCAVCVCCIAVGYSGEALSPCSISLHPGAASFIAAAQSVTFMPKLQLAEARTFVDGADGMVIDARFPEDYRVGHIHNAINIPVDATDAQLGEVCHDWDRRRPLLLYCQSNKCQYAEKVAKRLVMQGFSDIRLFPGGWKEWQQ